MEPSARIQLLHCAACELLESENNGTMVVGVRGSDCEPLVVTALGCSVVVALGGRSILVAVSSLARARTSGPRALAEGCDRALTRVHDLPSQFVPTITFADPANARRFRQWLR